MKVEKYFRRYKIIAEPFNPEILSSILWEVDIKGISEEDNFLYVFASYDSKVNCNLIIKQLNKLKTEDLVENFTVKEKIIKNKNWNEEWEKNLKVVKISDRIVIKPSFKEYEKKGNELVITIDPKMSFGTGEHVTTRLVTLMLEKHLQKGDRVLDVGSGTGILSIAAVKLGAESALAIDNDNWCYENGKENCLLNNVESKIEIRNCEIAEVDEKNFPLIISNIQKNVLLSIAEEFMKRIKLNGTLILSGLLIEDKDDIVNKYNTLGFNLIDSKQMDEWMVLVFKSE
ncbi:MAG: 50S ribosomal protein L11 methyltransferase [Bacteroidetes bacterium]|nr:50S ribosomal protein L11 methyltransferase [Bacteroidota bacterium]